MDTLHPGATLGAYSGNGTGPTLARHPGTDDGATLAEAAATLGLSVDAVRRRVRRDDLAATLTHGPRGPEYRISRDTLARHRGATVGSHPGTRVGATLADDGDPRRAKGSHPSGDPGAAEVRASTSAALARAAAAERERDRLSGEVDFLRARLVNAETERQELRVLLAQQAHALATLSEQRALPPAQTPEATPPEPDPTAGTGFLSGAPAIRPTPEPAQPPKRHWWQRRRP